MQFARTLQRALLPLATIVAVTLPTISWADTVLPVQVEPVQQTRFASLVKEVGKIKAIDSTTLSFNASEKIQQINFHDGDLVKKGDIIAELNNTKAKLDFTKAKNSLALKQTKLDRLNGLLAKEPYAMSKQDVDEVTESYYIAKADFALKQVQLKDYQIIAPFDGRLTSFNQSIGSHINAGTTLVTLYKLDPVKVKYAIGQEDLAKAQKGQKVEITVEAFAKQNFKGQVSYVAPNVDDQSGRIEIQAVIDNPEHHLAPGMFANIKHYFSRGNLHLTIPQNAVIANNNQRYVWVVANNKAIKRDVTLGKNINNGYVVVTAGLYNNEQVIVSGMQNLSENSLIKILPPQASKAPQQPPKTATPAATSSTQQEQQ
ncbi:efflux RND transporter periplasmic adaptor subunit [Shewanella intestini]|uniref:Efflux RND transporter periplasmic adaptor subunit n=1 Tax=Shewanella intestini TaxID=2017544 RepID=A0ABS5I5A7_9GAMM|nr:MULTISPECIES: efflux RND transporter periplasmic adaptor subunit [Shewanella]MBR9729210.1 efflux RND transporter periplasmic adaptor subunit [Shewanella intestini]MRG37219.1 efflux RND transporter periplasmic adaptor subunit [Shewanella sp. XMDDZSB0408]